MPKLGQRSPGCTIPIQMIEEHFEKRMVGDNTEFSPDPDLLKDFAPQDGAQLEEPISSNAVWYRLLKMGNTAPGPDGISYQELKRVDPKATILTQIFQVCFQMRAVPPSWKESSSILLNKKGDAEDICNNITYIYIARLQSLHFRIMTNTDVRNRGGTISVCFIPYSMDTPNSSVDYTWMHLTDIQRDHRAVTFRESDTRTYTYTPRAGDKAFSWMPIAKVTPDHITGLGALLVGYQTFGSDDMATISTHYGSSEFCVEVTSSASFLLCDFVISTIEFEDGVTYLNTANLKNTSVL
ncbi:hypothetical protein LAZ67_1008429 [Cordylochernes scorpioides]|uniref:Uncharacterized protein n=1 Tax=Cordylochernes scorpioides TaxID=51811 RepID=A0ABY6K4X6_9ARAC|nr:hypothetical protein LAZ67_1008429 [Cordylochernes scorpioides]